MRRPDALFQNGELIAQCPGGVKQRVDDRKQHRVASESFADAPCPSGPQHPREAEPKTPQQTAHATLDIAQPSDQGRPGRQQRALFARIERFQMHLWDTM